MRTNNYTHASLLFGARAPTYMILKCGQTVLVKEVLYKINNTHNTLLLYAFKMGFNCCKSDVRNSLYWSRVCVSTFTSTVGTTVVNWEIICMYMYVWGMRQEAYSMTEHPP